MIATLQMKPPHHPTVSGADCSQTYKMTPPFLGNAYVRVRQTRCFGEVEMAYYPVSRDGWGVTGHVQHVEPLSPEAETDEFTQVVESIGYSVRSLEQEEWDRLHSNYMTTSAELRAKSVVLWDIEETLRTAREQRAKVGAYAEADRLWTKAVLAALEQIDAHRESLLTSKAK